MAMKKFQMLNLICESCVLTSKEKLVAQYFVYKSNKSGECYPAVNTIAKHCGVSERTVQRATRKLQEKNYITIEKRYYKGRQSSNEYSLNTELIKDSKKEVITNFDKNTTLPATGEMEFILFEESIFQAEAELYGNSNMSFYWEDNQVLEVSEESNINTVSVTDKEEPEEYWLDYDMIDIEVMNPFKQSIVLEQERDEEYVDAEKTVKETSICTENRIRASEKYGVQILIGMVLNIYCSEINFGIVIARRKVEVLNELMMYKRWIKYALFLSLHISFKHFFMTILGVP